MPTEIHHFIAGRRFPGASGRSAPVFNPATGQQSGSVALASVDDVRAAVAAAREAGRKYISVASEILGEAAA